MFDKNHTNHIKKKTTNFAKNNKLPQLSTPGSLETFFYYASIHTHRKIIVIIKEKEKENYKFDQKRLLESGQNLPRK